MKIFSFLFVFVSLAGFAQNGVDHYNFKSVYNVEATPIKSQDRTGTCWSFSTTSFLESELIRMGKGQYDLSEMYSVRKIYEDKAWNYVMRQGKANFSQGSLAHDVLRVVKKYGVVPEKDYSGKVAYDIHDHTEMENAMKGFLDGVTKSKTLSTVWDEGLAGILDAYLGEVPEKFTVDGKSYTPVSYAKMLDIDPDDYVTITSFQHVPFYESFILNIPDNYSNGSFYNVPLDDLVEITNNALKNGFSVAWDTDVSERGFSPKNGVAIVPEQEWASVSSDEAEMMFKKPVQQRKITQESRQQEFENYNTTDDHLMHITGLAKDDMGVNYYMTKNSWGKTGCFEGFIYVSEPFFRLKTISVLVHKDALPKGIAKKLFDR